MAIELACKQCGRKFRVIPSRLKSGKPPQFCSYKCKGLATRKPRVEQLCQNCGETFFVTQTTVEKGFGKYCSQSCMGNAYRSRVITTCKICGKEILAKESEYKRGRAKYCSYKCMGIAYKASCSGPCENCGKIFSRPISEWDKAERHFCSPKCQYAFLSGENSPAWKGGTTPEMVKARVGREHINWRKAVLERDKHICRLCSKPGQKLQAHHLYSFTRYPHLRYSVSNGHTLCVSCHRKITCKEDDYLRSIGFDPEKPPLFF